MNDLNFLKYECYSSDCLITMADCSKKKLKNLNKGDKIQSYDENNIKKIASIICILEIKIKYGISELVNFESGLSISPWNLIKYRNKWEFAANIKAPTIKSCNSIIGIILDNYHIGFINGYQCATIGHNKKNRIENNFYYKSDEIINIMKNNYGWESGKVVLNISEN